MIASFESSARAHLGSVTEQGRTLILETQRLIGDLYAIPYMADAGALLTTDGAGRPQIGYRGRSHADTGVYRGFEDLFRGAEQFWSCVSLVDTRCFGGSRRRCPDAPYQSPPYPPAFRAEAVRLVLSGGKSIPIIANGRPLGSIGVSDCRRRNASGRCADVKLVHPMPLPPRPSLHPVPVARVSATMAP